MTNARLFFDPLPEREQPGLLSRSGTDPHGARGLAPRASLRTGAEFTFPLITGGARHE